MDLSQAGCSRCIQGVLRKDRAIAMNLRMQSRLPAPLLAGEGRESAAATGRGCCGRVPRMHPLRWPVRTFVVRTRLAGTMSAQPLGPGGSACIGLAMAGL